MCLLKPRPLKPLMRAGSVGGEPGQDHYSPLAQINRSNVSHLQLAWTYDTGEPGGKAHNRSLETTPIIVGGVLYGLTPSQKVFALNAATGELLWQFDAGIPGTQPDRGLTYWASGNDRRIFVGVMNFVYALNAQTGKPITASIGRYGPYLAHDGKYAKLGSTAEVFETGMNAAVVKLADAASGGGRQRGASREPVAVLGKHPTSGGEIKVMAGRYGPYVTDGTTNATLPKGMEPKAVTLDEAVKLIDERAAKGPAKKGGRKGGRKKVK